MFTVHSKVQEAYQSNFTGYTLIIKPGFFITCMGKYFNIGDKEDFNQVLEKNKHQTQLSSDD